MANGFMTYISFVGHGSGMLLYTQTVWVSRSFDLSPRLSRGHFESQPTVPSVPYLVPNLNFGTHLRLGSAPVSRAMPVRLGLLASRQNELPTIWFWSLTSPAALLVNLLFYRANDSLIMIGDLLRFVGVATFFA